MKSSIALLSLMLSTAFLSSGQLSDSLYIDSVLNILPSRPDSVKVDLYFDLGERSRWISLEESAGYFRQSAVLALSIDPIKNAMATKSIGINHIYGGQNDSALHYLQLALDGFSAHDDISNISATKETIGVVYQRSNEPDKALAIYQEIMEEVAGTDDWLSAVGARVNAIGVMINQKNYEPTLPYIAEAEAIIDEKAKDKKNQENIEFFRPQLYINAGLAYLNLEDYGRSEDYFLKAIKDAEANQNDGILAYCYNSLGEMKKKIAEERDESSEYIPRQNDLKRALQYFEKAEASFMNVNDQQGLSFVKLNMASALTQLNRYDEALVKLESGEEIIASIDNPKMRKDFYEQMYELSLAQKDTVQAFRYHLDFVAWKDSIFNESRDERIQEMEAKYQTAIKEQEIGNLTQQTKLQRYLFIFSVVGLLALGSILWNRYQLRKREEEAEKEREINQAMSAFVPNSFIKMLGRSNILDVNLGDQVEKNVTVVFTDIRSFTSISEKMTPSDNFEFVRKYAARMGPPIQRNNGFVNQYLGDGIMAIFERSPDDALKACIDMFRALKAFNAEGHIDRDIRVGMGMHTGSLVMGIIGDDNRKDAATISDTVNTAARIESVTKAFGASLLVSQDTYEQFTNVNQFNFRALGHVRVHGKSLPINIYECIDHYSTEVKALRQSTIQHFDQGVKLFFERSFVAARDIFLKILEIDPEDNVSKSFVQRADRHLNEVVQSD